MPELAQPAAPGARDSGFRDVMEGAIGSAEQARGEAVRSVGNFLAGEGQELHATLLATQRAELAFDLFLQARNKVVQAYQEIMRMQV
jgi:flagellar hook-basal body complex protein FliE